MASIHSQNARKKRVPLPIQLKLVELLREREHEIKAGKWRQARFADFASGLLSHPISTSQLARISRAIGIHWPMGNPNNGSSRRHSRLSQLENRTKNLEAALTFLASHLRLDPRTHAKVERLITPDEDTNSDA